MHDTKFWWWIVVNKIFYSVVGSYPFKRSNFTLNWDLDFILIWNTENINLLETSEYVFLYKIWYCRKVTTFWKLVADSSKSATKINISLSEILLLVKIRQKISRLTSKTTKSKLPFLKLKWRFQKKMAAWPNPYSLYEI